MRDHRRSVLIALYDELKTYPIPARKMPHVVGAESLAVPFQMRMGDDVLSFISTTTVFGTPLDVTLSELALETFFPSDDKTAAFLREMAKTLG